MSGEAAAIGSSAGTSSGAGYTQSSSSEENSTNPFFQTINMIQADSSNHKSVAFNIADILGNGLGNGTGISFMG